MKVFGFNSPYTEEFDPYLVPAETVEEASEKIREAYPTRIFSIYEMKVIPHPGLCTNVEGIYSLDIIGTLRGNKPELYKAKQ